MSPLQVLALDADQAVDFRRVGVATCLQWFGTSGSGPSTITSSVLPTWAVLQAKATSCWVAIKRSRRRLFTSRQMAVEPGRRRAGLERIGENAGALETASLARKSTQFLELRLGFAGEADDERGPQRQVGIAVRSLPSNSSVSCRG